MIPGALEAVAATLAEHGATVSVDRGEVRCRVGDADLIVACDQAGGPVLTYAPPVDHEGLLAVRGGLSNASTVRVERVDGSRFALVTQLKEPTAPEQVAAWVSGMVAEFRRSREPTSEATRTTSGGLVITESESRQPSADPVSAGESKAVPLGLRQIEHPDAAFNPGDWAGPMSKVAVRVAEKSREALESYRQDRLLIDEHANKELGTAQGGYGRRQVYELVQNAADEMLESPGGMIKLVITDVALYCANEGKPVSVSGVNALLMSDLSIKRGNEIGRFGLGFKSVLAITKRPVFLSRSGSFRFDPDDASQLVRAVWPKAERVPYLRTAIPIDPREEAAADEVLSELMGWATSVVKLPKDEPEAENLHEDLAKFPSEFLLFSPHVGRLVVEDLTAGLYREVTVEQDGNRFTLVEDGQRAQWSVFRRDHRPSDIAKHDAGEISRRDVVPIVWAVKQTGQRGRGQFWAFFPTEVKTTLSGIVNAPWKTNSDRQALLEGAFNRELVQIVAELVVENLANLAPAEDPGRLFDILPARGRGAESGGWADDIINDETYALAAMKPCLPDQTGRLRMRNEVRIAPVEVSKEGLASWASHAGRPEDWLHHSALSTIERRSKAERLLLDNKNAVADYAAWLEALTSSRTPEASIAALTVAQLCRTPALRVHESQSIDAARILLTSDGAMSAVNPRTVFLFREGSDDGMTRVHPLVQADAETLEILTERGIRDVGQEDEYKDLLRQIGSNFLDWDRFWRETADLAPARALALIRELRTIARFLRFRTVAGKFVDRTRVLLPGGIVTEADGEDADWTVDVRYHEQTLEIVRGLGIQAGPIHNGMFENESWFLDYVEAMVREHQRATRDLRQKPDPRFLRPNQTGVLGPLSPMLRLSEAAVTRFTEQILGTDTDPRVWKIQHTTSGSYPAVPVEDPVTWFVRQHGLVPTTRGPRRVKGSIGPALTSLSDVLPVASCSNEWAVRLGLPATLESLTEAHWAEAFAAADGADASTAARFYSIACKYAAAPPQLRCLVAGADELRPTDAIFVTADADERDSAAETEVPIIYLPAETDAHELATAWGLRAYEGLAETTVDAIPKGDPIPLVEAFPDLRPYIHRRDAQLELVRCADLRLASVGPGGRRTVRVPFAREDGRVYWLDDAGGDFALLRRLSDELDLGLKNEDVDEILAGREDVDARALIATLRAEAEPPAKLLRAVGRAAIVRRLSPQLIAAVEDSEGPLDDSSLAQLAASQFGIDLFREFKVELLEVGLTPPERWAGSPNARRFVQSLGLPRPYAGYEEARLDPLYEVDGPATLGPLHEFQQELTKRIRSLLTGTEGRRALLWLPTGAGKTRVTVQALIRAVKEDGLAGPILWIAPTQELCEQAVQTWAYVWRSVGPRSRLMISRLWESKEAEEGRDDALHVVVATDAKLGVVLSKPDYEWLAGASVVIVDEAHGSTETGYTKILHWLGLGRDQTKDRCPLIGLTATPFKGTSVEATERLARRYGSRLLSDGVLGDDPYATLQEMRVLARAKQRVLGGSTITLTEKQARTAQDQNRLPPEVEELLGEDKTRNEAIVRTILELDSTWKILVFAASVAHAHQLAAILNLRGVRAAAVSSKTNPGARRIYIREFNQGSLRVLTNYGVLAEGFDAPSVRAVIVARPTLSPGIYQQMIGRGLRGPLNGGKDECLIVNVEDNILRFGGQLAFHHFDYLFDA